MPDEDASTEAPHSTDFFFVRPSAEELGLKPMSLPELRDEAKNIPFQPGFFTMCLFSLRIWPIWMDGQKQIDLAMEVFGDVPLIGLYRSFLERYPAGVPFSQQQFFIAQRLLVDHAQEGGLDTPLTADEVLSLSRLLVHSHDLADVAGRPIATGQADFVGMIAYTIQAGAYWDRPALLNTHARSFNLFLERARANEDERVPLEEWSLTDYQTTLEEQLAGGFAFAAVTSAFDPDPKEHKIIVEGAVLKNTSLAEREGDIASTLGATRAWYQEQFAAGDQSPRDIVWEITPFLRKPFLRLDANRLVLVAPPAINHWIGQGFYDRLRESAKARKKKKDDRLSLFGSHYGDLVEDYALDLVKSVYTEGRVHGDLPYGKGGGLKTPDVAIDQGADVVLIEVRSGILSPWFRTSGDVAEFADQLDRLVFKKIGQLARALADLRQKTATIPGIDFDKVERIWPILVTASLTQTELLIDWIRGQIPAALRAPGVQPLLLLDIEDLEILMALVETGNDLVEMLSSREAGGYAKLELKRWVLEELKASPTMRAKQTLEAWGRATESIKEILGWTDLPSEIPA